MRGQPTTLHCGISLVNRGSETPIEFPITGLLGRNNFRLARQPGVTSERTIWSKGKQDGRAPIEDWAFAVAGPRLRRETLNAEPTWSVFSSRCGDPGEGCVSRCRMPL